MTDSTESTVAANVTDAPATGQYSLLNTGTGRLLTLNSDDFMEEGADVTLQEMDRSGPKTQKWDYVRQDIPGYIGTFTSSASRGFVKALDDKQGASLVQTFTPVVYQIIPVKSSTYKFHIKILSDSQNLVLGHKPSGHGYNVELVPFSDTDIYTQWDFHAV